MVIIINKILCLGYILLKHTSKQSIFQTVDINKMIKKINTEFKLMKIEANEIEALAITIL